MKHSAGMIAFLMKCLRNRGAGGMTCVFIALLPVGARDACAQAATLFDVLEIAVEGNSKLADIDIERAVTPFLGEQKSLRDVEGARAALEKAYQDSGYLSVVVSIPEQEVANGMVTLSVVEGAVDRLRVRGAQYHPASEIRRRLPELAEGNVPYFPQMQRELDAVNRAPNLKATPVLKPGRAPGTVAVQLDVQDELPLHGGIELSNRQSANTTPLRASANVRYDNLFARGHSLALTVQNSPQQADEVRVAAATYVLPLGTGGDALALYSVLSRSKLATLAGAPGLGLLGNTTILGARYAMALRGVGNYSHSLSLGLDYKDVKQTTVLVSSGDQSPSPVAYWPLVAAYNGAWLGAGGSTFVELSSSVGVRGLFGNRDSDFAARRLGAAADFATLRGSLRQVESLARWTLTARLDAQLASGPLVTNEQFAAGGAESVRGYLESERVGDAGTRYAFEARTPGLPLFTADAGWRVNAIGFFEGAALRTLEPVFPTPAWRHLQGAGVGLRMAAPRGFSLDLDWARALKAGDLTRAGDQRFHVRLMWEI
jgi:hemolysin activation/secretion protein